MCADRRIVVLFPLWAGCGSLVGTDYRGEVLLELSGQVITDGSLSFEHDIGVTLLWSLNLDDRADQQAVVTHTTFPSRYTIEVYHPPGAGSYQQPFGEDWLEVAIGQPVLFEDVDGDGWWDRNATGKRKERVVGGSSSRAIVWVDRLDGGAVAPGGWVPERTGFHVVDVFREPCIERGIEGLPMVPAEGGTDLEVGYYWQSILDLDCDGDPDWNPEGTVDDPYGECVENADGYRQRCEEYRLAAGMGDPVLASSYLEQMMSDPCMMIVCPEVIEELLNASVQPTGTWSESCPPPELLEDHCRQIEENGAHPILGPALRDQLLMDPTLAECLVEVCAPSVEWLFSEPWL